MRMLSIIDSINEFIEPFKGWIEDNHNNPFMWLAFVLIGIAVFALTYNALNKNNQQEVFALDYTLVVMAAGMGSRFGSLKQITPVGPNGEFIIDYSVYDALRAGFNKVVFIIRKDFYQEFRETIGKRLEGQVNVEYVFQELNDLPAGYECPKNRVKPWGTGSAIYSVRDKIHGNFAVINADDFYGSDAYKVLFDYVKNNTDENKGLALCYEVGNTLSKNGKVKRGIASSEHGVLKGITESKIEAYDGYVLAKPLDGSEPFKTSNDTLVTVNLFGFTPKIKDIIVDKFALFLDDNIDKADSEYLVPDVINEEILKGNMVFDVKGTSSKWYGVTYKEDKDELVEAINNYIKEGVYPEKLF